VAIFLDKVVWHCRVLGREHIPDGPVILAGNHTGLMDGPVVIGATPRGTHFLVKQELTKGLLGKVMSAAGQVPVDRSDGSQALQVCLQLLERGQIVGIFPEGTRGDGRMDRIHAGVGWLAVHSGAPVVPFACLGTRRQGEAVGKIPPFRRRMLVEFGPAIELDLASTTNTRQQVTASLVPIAQGLAAHVAAVVDRTGLKLPTDSGRKDQR